MLKSIPTFVICFALLSIFGLYHIKHHVKYLKKEIITAKQQLYTEQEALHVLHAEWSYLNEPSRLRQLVEMHLSLRPMEVVQIYPDMLKPSHVAHLDIPHEESRQFAVVDVVAKTMPTAAVMVPVPKPVSYRVR